MPRVPAVLVGELSTVPEILGRIARASGLMGEEAATVVRLCPRAIAEAPCFLDRRTGLWRYEFGLPFADLPGAGTVLGTHMFHPVDHLFLVLRCASERLPDEKLASYLLRLADPNKHEDLLVEFVPIVRLPRDVAVEYEVPGYATGNQTVDWRIAPESGRAVLLDVKNRTRDLMEGLARIGLGERSPSGTGPAPAHDPSILFRSIESKFGRQAPSDCLQGAWICTYLRQEERELHDAFLTLDPDRVHFAILGDWRSDGYILVVDEALRGPVRKLFLITESKRFVFTRQDEG